MLAPVTHVIPVARIRRRRMLPVKGKVLVRGGQNVSATDVLAEATITPKYIALDIARALGVQPGDVPDFLLREEGEEVEAGALIAKGRGIFPREVRAPEDGLLVAISGGQALLEQVSRPFQLQAGLPGVVAEVEADLGCIIEANGAWIQGVWGNGKVNAGNLKVYAEGPADVLRPDQFSPDHRGSIVLTGQIDDRAALQAAGKNEISGLIAGSITTRLRPIAAQMPYSIIVLDGFGSLPVNQAAFNLLSTSGDRYTTINAEPYDRFKGTRPEVIIPLEGGSPVIPRDLETFEVGQRVRVIKAPHAAMIATISELPAQLVRFPSGLRAAGAQIEFEDGDSTLVPLANIEVIG